MGAKEGQGAQDETMAEPLEVWFWTQGKGESQFVSERVFQRPEQREMRPRLLIPMQTFEAANRAYIDAAVLAEKSMESATESNDLLCNLRKGYWKELEHLREMLKAAREQLVMYSSGAASLRAEANAKLDEYIMNTEVYYFDIVDGLDPELKAIFKECLKRFQRDLLTENFDLKEQLLAFTDPNDPNGPKKILMYLLDKKRATASQLAHALHQVVSGTPEQLVLEHTFYEILGLDPEAVANALKAAGKKTGKSAEELEIERLRAELERLREKNRDQEEQLEAAKAQIARLLAEQQKNQAALMELEKLKAKLAEMEKDYERLKNIEKEKLDLEQKLFAATAELKRLQAQIKQLEGELSGLRAKCAKLETELMNLQRQLEQAQADLKAALAKGEPGNPQAEAEVLRLRQKVQELEARIAELEQELQDARDALARAMERDPTPPASDHGEAELIAELKARVKELEDELAAMKAENERLRAENESLRDEVSTLEKKNRALQAALDARPEQVDAPPPVEKDPSLVDSELLDSARRENDELRARIAALEAEMEELRAALKKAEENWRRLERLMNARNEDDGFPPHWNDATLMMRWFMKKFGSIEIALTRMDPQMTGKLSYETFCEALHKLGYLEALAKRFFAVLDMDMVGELKIDDLTDAKRNEWYARATVQDHVEREEREWSDALHFKDMLRLREELHREHHEREAERKLWEEKEEALKAQLPSSGPGGHGLSRTEVTRFVALERRYHRILQILDEARAERDEMIGRATSALWRIRQDERRHVQMRREKQDAVEQQAKLQRRLELIKKNRKSLGLRYDDDAAAVADMIRDEIDEEEDPSGAPKERHVSSHLVGHLNPWHAPYVVRRELFGTDIVKRHKLLLQDAEFRARQKGLPEKVGMGRGGLDKLAEGMHTAYANMVFEQSVRDWVAPSPARATIQRSHMIDGVEHPDPFVGGDGKHLDTDFGSQLLSTHLGPIQSPMQSQWSAGSAGSQMTVPWGGLPTWAGARQIPPVVTQFVSEAEPMAFMRIQGSGMLPPPGHLQSGASLTPGPSIYESQSYGGSQKRHRSPPRLLKATPASQRRLPESFDEVLAGLQPDAQAFEKFSGHKLQKVFRTAPGGDCTPGDKALVQRFLQEERDKNVLPSITGGPPGGSPPPPQRKGSPPASSGAARRIAPAAARKFDRNAEMSKSTPNFALTSAALGPRPQREMASTASSWRAGDERAETPGLSSVSSGKQPLMTVVSAVGADLPHREKVAMSLRQPEPLGGRHGLGSSAHGLSQQLSRDSASPRLDKKPGCVLPVVEGATVSLSAPAR